MRWGTSRTRVLLRNFQLYISRVSLMDFSLRHVYFYYDSRTVMFLLFNVIGAFGFMRRDTSSTLRDKLDY